MRLKKRGVVMNLQKPHSYVQLEKIPHPKFSDMLSVK